MESSNDIVVVGSCMIDLVSYADRLPKEGETIHGTSFETNFGGKGANQCVAAAKIGGKLALIARVGEDDWADKYIANLKSLNIDTKHVSKTTNFTTGIAQIAVADNGANQIVIIASANKQLKTNDILKAKTLIENAKVLVCQLETPEEAAIQAMTLSRGISILNGAPAPCSFDPNLLKLATIFCVNETEATVFSGIEVSSVKDAERAIDILLEKGCKSVIITLGKNGAVYRSKDCDRFTHSKPEAVKAVDSTGAGDAFIGALAYVLAYYSEMDMQMKLNVACAVATESVKKKGTQNSFIGKEEFLKIL